MRWLRRDVPNLEEVAAAISRVVAEGRRAGAIVTRIRAFLKKTPSQQDVLEIAEIIEEAALLVDHELSKDNIILAIETDAELPPIRGDRIQIQQVLVNLIINAGQAMSKQVGPRIVTVQTGLAASGSLAITVKDTGPGIAPEDLSRLFEPFFSTKHGGMGMGLAICRTTVEKLMAASHVRADSAPALLRRDIPPDVAHDPRAHLAMTRPSDKANPAANPPSRSIAIAIVDDDAAVRDSLDSLFRPSISETRLFGLPAQLLASAPPGAAWLDRVGRSASGRQRA